MQYTFPSLTVTPSTELSGCAWSEGTQTKARNKAQNNTQALRFMFNITVLVSLLIVKPVQEK